MAGIAMALLAMTQNIGAMVGPAVIGSFFQNSSALAEVSNWNATIPFMLGTAAVGIVLAFFSKNKKY
jgi:hypothetical protein